VVHTRGIRDMLPSRQRLSVRGTHLPVAGEAGHEVQVDPQARRDAAK
jgi:hypothetical protein